jgi:copper chaperone NosL
MPDLRLRHGMGACFLLLALAACSGDPGTGPLDVKWDRLACERCRMVLSDRRHAAEIRAPQADGRSSVHFFDDIGCALVWLEDKPFRDDPRTEIWVADWRSGVWIDARKASYLAGQTTPMGYGLGAQAESDPQGVDFAAARERIFEVERKYNVHGAHLESGAPGR